MSQLSIQEEHGGSSELGFQRHQRPFALRSEVWRRGSEGLKRFFAQSPSRIRLARLALTKWLRKLVIDWSVINRCQLLPATTSLLKSFGSPGVGEHFGVIVVLPTWPNYSYSMDKNFLPDLIQHVICSIETYWWKGAVEETPSRPTVFPRVWTFTSSYNMPHSGIVALLLQVLSPYPLNATAYSQGSVSTVTQLWNLPVITLYAGESWHLNPYRCDGGCTGGSRYALWWRGATAPVSHQCVKGYIERKRTI